MFLIRKSNKLLSVFLILCMIIPSVCAMGADNEIYSTDFSDLTAANLSGIEDTSKSFYTSSGTSYPMYANNPRNKSGTGTFKKGNDNLYGNTLIVTKSGTYNSAALGVEIRPVFDTSKNVVIKTAIKRNHIDGGDVRISMQGISGDASATSTGFKMVKMKADGTLWVNNDMVSLAETQAGKYNPATWYEFTIEYSASTKFAQVTIDGGSYENVVLYKENMSGNQADRIFIGFDTVVSGLLGDFELAYLKVDYTNAKSYEDMKILNTFESFKTGNLIDSSYKSGSGFYYYENSMKHNNFASESDFQITNFDAEHGKVLKVKNNGKMNQFVFALGEPYSKKISSGVAVLEFSARLGEGMMVGTLISPSAKYAQNYVSLGDSLNSSTVLTDRWYNFVYKIDISNKKIVRMVYDVENPENNSVSEFPVAASEEIKEINVVVKDVDTSEADSFSYIDNILIYTEKENLEIMYSSPQNGSTDGQLNQDIVLSFNHELIDFSADSVTLSSETTENPDYSVSLLPCRRKIIIKPNTLLSSLHTYSVSISGVADSAGNVINKSDAIKFKTADYITVNAPVFKDGDGKIISSIQSGDISTTVNVRFNDGINRSVLVIFGIYDKSDNSLCAVDTKKITDVWNENIELAVNIPDGEFYAELCVLDSYTGLKPYIKKFRLE